jgi:hypothetical protein
VQPALRKPGESAALLDTLHTLEQKPGVPHDW